MQTTKIFMNGKSQAVRIPKEFRFSGQDVGIKKIGKTLLIYSLEDAWEDFLKCPPATDDFVEAVLSARKNLPPDTPRMEL